MKHYSPPSAPAPHPRDRNDHVCQTPFTMFIDVDPPLR